MEQQLLTHNPTRFDDADEISLSLSVEVTVSYSIEYVNGRGILFMEIGAKINNGEVKLNCTYS